MDITERIAAAARLALDAAETELRAVLAAQNGGGRGDLRQIKDALALLKELTPETYAYFEALSSRNFSVE